MGQRVQIIFVKEYKDKNIDIAVYHNQWGYGKGLVYRATKIIKALKNKYMKKISSFRINEVFDVAINYAENSNYNLLYKLCLSFKEDIKETINVDTFLNYYDNNNGYLLIYIDEKDNISYGFITGTEDTDLQENITPINYLKLFYNEKELNKKDIKNMLKFLSNEKQIIKPIEFLENILNKKFKKNKE